MCGISFLYDQSISGQESLRRTRTALDRILHRGPDGSGVASGDHWAMGHRRLAIIDIAGSPQPFIDPQQRYHLTYNGEIYNYKELKTALEPHWHFVTHGDTEVLLAGLVIHGQDFLQKMEGMWAFAFWDNSARSLTVGRDRIGKKPLYYQTSNSHFSCASELSALRAQSGAEWKEDLVSTADYFRYGVYKPGYTAYQDVFELPPGHVGRWTPGAGFSQAPYWTLNPQQFSGSRSQGLKKLRETFISAVERRLVADVEVGAFLSGGIDSSLISAVITRELGKPLKTFTIGFTDKQFDESSYARLAASALHTEHFEEFIDEFDESTLEAIIKNNVGQPFADASILPTSLVSQIASKHLKVVLSGDGGDELFCGYQRYRGARFLDIYNRTPAVIQRAFSELVKAMPEPGGHHSKSLLKKARLFQDIVERQDVDEEYLAPTFFSQKQLQQLIGSKSIFGHDYPSPYRGRDDSRLSRMMTNDVAFYLPQDILAKVDRASMAYSIEARAPFLDRALVELAFSFPLSWHQNFLSGKNMLRDAFTDLLPKKLWRRRKQGFGVPLQRWFKGALGQQLRVWSQESDDVIHPTFVLQLLDEHMSGHTDHGQRLWLIYNYLLWKRSSL